MKTDRSKRPFWAKKRYYLAASLLCCILLVISVIAGQRSSPLRISPETTVLTEPLTPDGKLVDYRRYYLERQDDGLGDPAENGFGDVLRAFGPEVLYAGIQRFAGSWDDFIKSNDPQEKNFRDNEWSYNCEKFGINPTSEPELWNQPELLNYYSQEEILPESKLTSPTTWSQEELQNVGNWVHGREKAFEVYEKALKKKSFGAYHIPNEDLLWMLDESLAWYDYSKTIARKLKVRAIYRIATDDPDGALDDQRLIFQLARLILNGTHCQLMANLCAFNILRIGMEIPVSINVANSEALTLLSRQAAYFDELFGDFRFDETLEQTLRNGRLFETTPKAVGFALASASERQELIQIYDEDHYYSYLLPGTISVASRFIDGNSFLERVNEFCDAASREGFDIDKTDFPVNGFALRSLNRTKRSREWADLFGTLVVLNRNAICGGFCIQQCGINLFRIQNAILQYQAENGTLPPAFTVDEAGKPLHSWRVLILPYLGEKERDLFSKIRLDEPWDSDYNRQYQTETPEVYHCPSQSAEGACYSVVVGPNSLFDESGAGKNLIELANDSEKNALGRALVVERSSPVCWMRPDAEISEEFAKDVNSDDDIPVSEYAGIGSAHNRTINIANASGIVRALNKALPEIKTEKEMEVW